MHDYLVRPNGLPPSNGYSHVVAAAGTTVFVSGQVPLGPDGTLAGRDAEAQADQVFRELQVALQAAGVGWGEVVKLTYFLTDITDLPTVRAVRDRYINGERPPASTLVQVAALVNPDFRIEIDAIAVRVDTPA